jgi:DeoR/GlpR family transcriptional regulator of sugar metabolism
MLTDQRRAYLLDRLKRDGRLVATDLALDLSVSEDTIRRDLRDLAAAGLLLRVHGGALPLSPTNRPLGERRARDSAEKRRLAEAAVRLIRPGQTVIVDGGTTHLALVAALPPDLSVTIVTHAPGIAAALEAYAASDVILIGGRIMRHSMVALGPSTHAAYAGLRADHCFLGVTGVAPEAGLTTGDAEEAALKGAMMACAAETTVLATAEKLGSASPWTIAPLDRLTRLVAAVARPGWLPDSAEFESV